MLKMSPPPDMAAETALPEMANAATDGVDTGDMASKFEKLKELDPELAAQVSAAIDQALEMAGAGEKEPDGDEPPMPTSGGKGGGALPPPPMM